MRSARPPLLTIAIPLHGAGRWIDGVVDTVEKAPDWSSVVISDASHLDDSLERLAARFRGDDRVSVIARREKLDWRSHANLLLDEAKTEFFCWMPQDDLLTPGPYFELLVEALDGKAGRVLAFPTVLKRVTRGRVVRREVDPVSFPSPPIELGLRRPELEAVEMLRSWNMAIAWRGVFRTASARPIPATLDAPDLAWTFSLALAGHFVEVPGARYLKRFHRGSAHRTMRSEGLAKAAELYRLEVEARLAGDPELRAEVLGQLSRILARRRFGQMVNPLRRAGRLLADAPRVLFD
jgi:hypothetical protein